MNQRFTLFRRAGIFYAQDSATGKQNSLRTKDKSEALTLLHAKNEAYRQPMLNLQIARTYLSACDPNLSERSWQNVMEQIVSTKSGATQIRWQSAKEDKAFDAIRHRKLVETKAEHFFSVLKTGTVSTNVYLRRAHNFALALNWLPWPVLPKNLWPRVQYKEKRAITFEEHQKIINRERNPATRAYFELLWHLGGSQSDVAMLTVEDIDWRNRTIAYRRNKTGVTALISFGDTVAHVLKMLPESGYLFPALAHSGTASRKNVHQAFGYGWHHRHFSTFLPLCLGGTGEGGRVSRTFCDASSRS